jgi:hypothetical protein
MIPRARNSSCGRGQRLPRQLQCIRNQARNNKSRALELTYACHPRLSLSHCACVRKEEARGTPPGPVWF